MAIFRKIEPEPTTSGKYRVRWRNNNKRYCQTFNTKVEAKKLCRLINRGELPEEENKSNIISEQNKFSNMTFDSLAKKYIKHHVKVNCSPSTLRNYLMYLNNHILPFFGKKKLHDLHLTQLDAFTAKMKTKKRKRGKKDRTVVIVKKNILGESVTLSEKTQRELQSLVITIVKFGYERDYLEKNPFKRFKLKKLNDQQQEYFSGKEVEKFLSWCEDGGPFVPNPKKLDKFGKPIVKLTDNIERDTEIFKFALHTGARQGEILGLKRKAIDFSNRLVWFSTIYDMSIKELAERTKGGNVRCVEMDDMVWNLLKKREHYGPEELIFGNLKQPMWKNTFYVYCNRARLKTVSFHALRHTFATAMALYTPPAVLQKILGHTSWTTTMKYVHIAQSESIGYTKYLKSVYREHRDMDTLVNKTLSRVS